LTSTTKPVRSLLAFFHEDRLQIDPSGFRGEHPAPRHVEEEDAAAGARFLPLCVLAGFVMEVSSPPSDGARESAENDLVLVLGELLDGNGRRLLATPSTMVCFNAGVTSGI